MTPEAGDAVFVGYTFRGSPERRVRLWFLDRQLYPLIVWGRQTILQGDDSELCDRVRSGGGASEEELRTHAVTADLDVGRWSVSIPDEKRLLLSAVWQPLEAIKAAMPGMVLRYESWGVEGWSMVWKLTGMTIPHVHTFGKDDTWRLGIWPD